MNDRVPRASLGARGIQVFAMAAALAACSGPGALAQTPDPAGSEGPPDGYAWVIFGSDTVVAEVAGTGDDRSQGLQDREEVPYGTGMLFTFREDPEVKTFWMKDTPVDLDIAFLDENLEIFQIIAMEANSLDLHDSSAPVTMALEVAHGWFESVGVGVGDRAVVVLGGG